MKPACKPVPFFCPEERQPITNEPDRRADHWTPEYPDVEWIGFQNQGGRQAVPLDFCWASNPKQWQEEYGTSLAPGLLQTVSPQSGVHEEPPQLRE